MPRSLTHIYIHAVWAVKDREPVLQPALRQALFRHIYAHLQEHGIRITRINGIEDHVHCLFALPARFSLAQVMQLIKGEAAHWLNEQQLLERPFQWQEGYAAFSVGRTSLPQVIAYIDQQEKHHQKFTYFDELQRMGQ